MQLHQPFVKGLIPFFSLNCFQKHKTGAFRLTMTGRSYLQNFSRVQYIFIQAIHSRNSKKALQLLMKNSLFIRLLTVKDTSSKRSPFRQSCSDPYLKIRPIVIFAFSSLNYSLAARLQDNSRPKSPTKVETKRKLQQFTVSG